MLNRFSPPDRMKNRSVFIDFSLVQILDVDERRGLLTLKIWNFVYYYSEVCLFCFFFLIFTEHVAELSFLMYRLINKKKHYK